MGSCCLSPGDVDPSHFCVGVEGLLLLCDIEVFKVLGGRNSSLEDPLSLVETLVMEHNLAIQAPSIKKNVLKPGFRIKSNFSSIGCFRMR